MTEKNEDKKQFGKLGSVTKKKIDLSDDLVEGRELVDPSDLGLTAHAFTYGTTSCCGGASGNQSICTLCL